MVRYGWLLLVALVTPAHGQDYGPVVAGLEKSVKRVAIQRGTAQGTCSAVVFDITDGRAHGLTAAHCVAMNDAALDFTVDDRSGKVEQSNRLLDLAIVTFRANSDTATMPLAQVTPRAGTEAIAAGYAFGVEDIVYQFGHVARPFNRETKQIWLNMDIIFGDSGGAILDATGHLIGITSSIYSSGPAHIGGAVSIEQVRDFIDEYRDHLKEQAKK